MEFILEFIVEFWLQLIQPKRKGLSNKKRRIAYTIGTILCFLLMCFLLFCFVRTGNAIGTCAAIFLLIVEIISILLVEFKRKHK